MRRRSSATSSVRDDASKPKDPTRRCVKDLNWYQERSDRPCRKKAREGQRDGQKSARAASLLRMKKPAGKTLRPADWSTCGITESCNPLVTIRCYPCSITRFLHQFVFRGSCPAIGAILRVLSALPLRASVNSRVRALYEKVLLLSGTLAGMDARTIQFLYRACRAR